LVSHDRTFLNNVVTSTLAFEETGQVIEYAGGYDDWLLQRPKPQKGPPAAKKNRREIIPKSKNGKAPRLGYQERLELAGLPQRINAGESEQEGLYTDLADPLLYKKGKEALSGIKTRLAYLEQEIETAYLRWEELDGKI
ncbi:MAG: ABC transporter ATP-binding protein, partial [Pseudomonadota bacterium]